MSFETTGLGYQLINGKLDKKHSERLNKFVAGLMDADGTFGLHFGKNTYLTLRFKITQSIVNDPEFIMMKSIVRYFGLGSSRVNIEHKWNQEFESFEWVVQGQEARKLADYLVKHSCIKAKHIDRLCYLYDNLRGFKLTPAQVAELKEYSTCSRENTASLFERKHPSWAWLAGYLAGDGCFYYKHRLRSSGSYSHEALVNATANVIDLQILVFLQKHFKGTISKYKNNNNFKWIRSLGKSHSKFAMNFLIKIRKEMCMIKKYDKIQTLINFHCNLPAETKRSNNES